MNSSDHRAHVEPELLLQGGLDLGEDAQTFVGRRLADPLLGLSRVGIDAGRERVLVHRFEFQFDAAAPTGTGWLRCRGDAQPTMNEPR